MTTEPLPKNVYVTKPIGEGNPQPAGSRPKSRTRSLIIRVLVTVPFVCLIAVASIAVGMVVSSYATDAPSGPLPMSPAASKASEKTQAVESSKSRATPILPADSRPLEAIADLPDYPGATRIECSTDRRAGFAKSMTVQLTTTDPFEQVTAFYDKAAADNGWALISRIVRANETESEFVKRKSVARVSISRTKGEEVVIQLERSDK